MTASSRVALVPAGKATAITVIVGLLMVVLPLSPVIVVPFLVLPAAYVVARWGVLNGVIVAALSGVLIYVGAGVGLGPLVFLVVLGGGTALGWSVRRNLSFGKSIGAIAGAALAALVVWGLLLWLVFGLSLSELRENAYSSIERAAALYADMGVSSATTASVSSQLRSIVDVVPYLTPGLVGMGVVLLAVCCLGLAYVFFPRLRAGVAVDQSLSRFRVHWATAYASIAGLAMLVFARGDGDWHSAVMYVGINILLVSQTLFFVQGLAVVRWFVITRQMRRGPRVALYVAAIVGQVFLQLTGFMGLLDTWVDYRKRFTVKSPGTGPIR